MSYVSWYTNLTYFSKYHEGHAEPPPGILEVAVALACLFIILLVGLQQAMLLDNKRSADEDARCDC